jgi:chromosome segregation ATPase
VEPEPELQKLDADIADLKIQINNVEGCLQKLRENRDEIEARIVRIRDKALKALLDQLDELEDRRDLAKLELEARQCRLAFNAA